MDPAQRIRFKTRLFTAIVVLSNAVGNLLLTWGLRHWDGQLAYSPFDYVRAFLNPWVTSGVVLLIVWLLARMMLLSWADLSYVLPVTAIGYVVSAIFGKLFLNEHISPGRWLGTALIFAGVVLVGRTAPDTTKREAV